jgi:hypothetical protein
MESKPQAPWSESRGHWGFRLAPAPRWGHGLLAVGHLRCPTWPFGVVMAGGVWVPFRPNALGIRGKRERPNSPPTVRVSRPMHNRRGSRSGSPVAEVPKLAG